MTRIAWSITVMQTHLRAFPAQVTLGVVGAPWSSLLSLRASGRLWSVLCTGTSDRVPALFATPQAVILSPQL